MEIKIRKKDLKLFFAWLLAALTTRAVLFWLLPYLDIFPEFTAPLISSLIIAMIQWLALRNFMDDAHQWAIFSFLGLSLSTFVISGFNAQIGNLFSQFYNGTNSYIYLFLGIFQAIQGLFVGLFQWFALRWNSPRALWWIFFSALATTISGMANIFYLNIVTASSTGGQISANQELFRNILTTSLSAIILGLALIWILQKTIVHEDIEEALEDFDFEGPEGEL